MRTAPLLATLLALIAAPGGAGPAPDTAAAVAVVYSLAGEASVILPARERRPLRLFDRLVAGTVVETKPGARLTLAFVDGRRYELGERSRATLGRAGLFFRTGTVRALPSVPPLPRCEPIADEDSPGLRAGAVRIRGESTAGIYPPAEMPPLPAGAGTAAEATAGLVLDLDHAAGRELGVAESLHDRGTMNAQRGDLPAAEDLLGQALAIREKLAPDSSPLAKTLASLGNVKMLQGELPAAEDLLRRALAIQEKIEPEGFEAAVVLTELGNVARVRLDVALAEALYRRAKGIFERTQPRSLAMANALKNLALVAGTRNDFETTDFYLRRALAIEEDLDSSGAGLAVTLNSLGLQQYGRRDFEKALAYLHRSVQLREKVAPDSLSLAKGLQNLGAVLRDAGDCAAAAAAYRRALDIRQRRGARDAEIARSFQGLGAQAFACGDLAVAEAFHRKALALYEKSEPDGHGRSETLFNLGGVARRQGRLRAAVEHFCQAADLFEARWDAVSGVQWREERYFPSCAVALAEAGRPEESFLYLERGRARALLKEIVERDGLGIRNLPEEVLRQKKEIARELESTQGALARSDPRKDPAEAQRLLDRLREIRDRQQELAQRIRRSGLRSATLQNLEPLDLQGARRALDPGTVLLSYLVDSDSEKTFLFVVHPTASSGPGVAVFPIAAGKEALEEKVRSLRELFRRNDSDPVAVQSLAADLYNLLLAPAGAEIGSARRLLISPHGPLHTLPFAALIRQGRYLAEWKPVHSVASATLYAELKRTRRPLDFARGELIAFGDPVYPRLAQDRDSAPAETREILTAVSRGLSLDPIPATRAEVESIAALFPRARIYVGNEATEERAKSLPAEARIIHFASHGLLDERFPLNSALALTMPGNPREGQENGLLQAWEIIDSVRLDADLVTLSACDTALGQERAGEGIIGLTRTFQYAGARSVLASLWSVSDVSTADLMKSFYGHLRAGKAKDEALQAAQTELIRSSGFSHPYHWAAFQLNGDWR